MKEQIFALFGQLIEKLKFTTEFKIGLLIFSIVFLKFSPAQILGVNIQGYKHYFVYILIIASLLLFVDIISFGTYLLNNLIGNYKYNRKKYSNKLQHFELLQKLDNKALGFLYQFYTRNSNTIEVFMAEDVIPRILLELDLIYVGSFSRVHLSSIDLDTLRDFFNAAQGREYAIK